MKSGFVDASPRAERWGRASRVALACLIVGTLLSLFWSVQPSYDLVNDASIYILTTRSLLDGEGYSYLGQAFTIRPPGFSCLLAPALALFGNDFHALNGYVSLYGVAVVVLLFVYYRPRVGVFVAWSLAVAVWLNPAFQQLCNQILSEMPGSALLFGALIVERWALRKPSLRRDALVALAVAAAGYVRTVHWLLAAAILCARGAALFGRGARSGAAGPPVPLRLVSVPALCLVALLPWAVRNADQRPAPPAQQAYLYSYSTAMWHEDPGDPASPRVAPGSVIERVGPQARRIVSLLGSRLGTAEGGVATLLLGGLFVVAVFSVLLRRRSAAEAFFAGNLLVLLVYFAWRDRLALPLFLLAFPALADATLELLRRPLGCARARIVVGVLVLLVAAFDAHPRADRDRIEATHRDYAAFARHVAAAVPESTTLAAPVGWHFAVYLDRPVYSLRWTVERARGETLQQILDRYDVGAVLFDSRRMNHPVDRLLWNELRDQARAVRETGALRLVVLDASR